MKKRIFCSIVWIVLTVLIVSDVLFTVLMYQQFLEQMKKEVKNNMTYVEEAVERGGMEYLSSLPRGDDNSRVTLIDTGGVVIYDSVEEADKMENHGDRDEFLQAASKGVGEAFRYSGSIGKQTYYYAITLEDGSILRLSSTITSVFMAIGDSVPILILFVVIAIGVSFVAANMQSKKLTAPINDLNLDEPLENDVYEELSPLLMRLENQNRQIKQQIIVERRQQKELHAITKSMQEGLMLVNPSEEILMINEACLTIFECENEQIDHYIGQHYLHVSRLQELSNVVKEALKGKTTEKIVTLHGHSYEIIANPVIDHNVVTGAVLIIMDVTESKQAENRRREFVANVSHELKTPLMSISGYAEIIQNGMVKTEDIPDFSKRIYQEAKRLTTLVEDIIRLSQFDDNEYIHAMEPVDLKNLSEKVVAYLQHQADKRQISMTVEGEPLVINGAFSALEEMIYNLCDNGVKYNKDGGSVKITLVNDGNERAIIVSDTGIGIPKESQDRVFERFYRVDKSHSRDSGGTGLGLSIVKHAALLHNATISLESKLSEGTAITVRF